MRKLSKTIQKTGRSSTKRESRTRKIKKKEIRLPKKISSSERSRLDNEERFTRQKETTEKNTSMCPSITRLRKVIQSRKYSIVKRKATDKSSIQTEKVHSKLMHIATSS